MAGDPSIHSSCMIQARPIGNVCRWLLPCRRQGWLKVLDVSSIEGSIPRDFGADAALVQGAKSILASLEAINAPWAIVTSGTRALVEGWLGVLKLNHPKTMVVAEDCETGKPDAEPYLLAKKRLGLSAEAVACVVEDSTAGK